ncbi:MAG: ABC transporter permease [Blautia sp.]|nr:ABC transporter permease [Blautia sp.]
MKRKPGRTAALILLAAFLAFSVFGGSIVVKSLQNGLDSYESRLGADVIIVPNQARSHGSIESILLQGIPGYFYMEDSVLEKARNTEGVEVATPQFYLASASAGCCSVSVQVIGFDPETDFTIKPWIRESYSGDFGDGDLIVGSNIEIPSTRKLTFYNVECNVAAKLARTGTGLDNAVYANMNTIRQMMESSVLLGFDYFSDVPAENAISSVMIKVADSYDIDQVTGDLNIHIRRVEATQAKTMISGIAEGLTGVSRVIGVMVLMIWLLSIVIMIVAFAMIVNERKKEFAVLRVVGASQKMLSRLLVSEAGMISLIGAVIGVGAASLVIFPFLGLIREQLDLPMLLPGLPVILVLLVLSIAVAVIAGALTSAISVRKITRGETGLILREDV